MSPPCRVIHLTRFRPSPVGHGGNHRSYQISDDCAQAVGAASVTTLAVADWEQARSATRLEQRLWDLRRGFAAFGRNPAKLLWRATFDTGRYARPALLRDFATLVDGVDGAAVCVIEDAGFAAFAALCRRRRIPVIGAVQNLESLDAGPLRAGAKLHNTARLGALSDEFTFLAGCAERLFVSQVEAGLVSGLGLSADYYPYAPTGQLRERLEAVRAQRLAGPIDTGLFVVVGTAGHESTATALRWLLEAALADGLPDGTRIVVVGRGTDQLLSASRAGSGRVECRGWVTDAQLDGLLARASGVLVPQFSGFGALTRLPEMACAGVPVITSLHASLAAGIGPGQFAVRQAWEAWAEAMGSVLRAAPVVPAGLPSGRNALVDAIDRCTRQGAPPSPARR